MCVILPVIAPGSSFTASILNLDAPQSHAFDAVAGKESDLYPIGYSRCAARGLKVVLAAAREKGGGTEEGRYLVLA